ncbi:Ig-like domain-containing domain [uncultured Lacinutrix sp.]|uniref:Ig-like domain-containing domain n=1 Tax=uncultured Lacinutrix sp. TaxID=574032 RepID=UPI002638039F|nr:Ig-like domain-containing domain [uncultured Lacinutrix sp.]
MRNTLLNFLLLIIIAVIFANCANRGNPSGGEKDIDPPNITKSFPENYSTNFTGNEIKIYFDEYIKIKDLSKQLIVSPPMSTPPEITPLGSASKYITIKIYDTLKPNTTYAFNFGNSIVDNNEENPYTYYRYVLSTGNYIDSLTVKGSIKDALSLKTDDFVSVMLYEKDSTYNDSTIYKRTPDYITNTLDSTTNFTIENVKAGTYILRALKDENSDNKFQQGSDKIGFYETPITVPNDSAFYDLKLFLEERDYKASKPKLVAGEKIAFGFEGNYESVTFDVLSNVPSNYKSRYIKDKQADTLNYFYSPKLDVDSLIFKVTNKKIIDTFTVKIKDNKKDSLIVSAKPSGNIKFNEDFKLNGNIPFEKIDKSKIVIIDKDSTTVSFNTDYDSISNTYSLKFNKTEENNYNIKVYPNALVDLFENTNDTLNYNLRTKTDYSYYNAQINIRNGKFPLIVQLTDKDGKVETEQYLTEEKPLDFLYLDPKDYYLRVVFDTNNNGVYDSGNYLKGMQPERVSYNPEIIKGTAGFDQIINFILLD